MVSHLGEERNGHATDRAHRKGDVQEQVARHVEILGRVGQRESGDDGHREHFRHAQRDDEQEAFGVSAQRLKQWHFLLRRG